MKTIRFPISLDEKIGKLTKKIQHRYALCVLIRDKQDTVVDKDYFVANAKFVTSIGKLVDGKVTGVESGLQSINGYKQGEIKTILEDERYTVCVSRSTWDEYLTFDDFIKFLKTDYFNINLT